jgi:hypothetical protein
VTYPDKGEVSGLTLDVIRVFKRGLEDTESVYFGTNDVKVW